jgi:hypothetical protein
MKFSTATFKAYQGASRDQLIDRLVDCPGWSHIGQVRASEEMNHVEVDVFFRGHPKRAKMACFRAQILGSWKLQRFE